MKKRNKKYNPLARAEKTARAFLSTKAVAWCGTKQAQLFNVGTLKPVRLTEVEALAITEVQHIWNVYLVMMLRDHTGRDYMNTYPIKPVQAFVGQISDSVQEQLAAVVKEQNSNHLINIGWVCTTIKDELTDNQIDSMMTTLGGWEFLAKHEIKDDTEILDIN